MCSVTVLNVEEKPNMSDGPHDRKRSSDGDGFYGDSKRPRTEKPPATLRVLVRNRDAGGIIGKAGENIKRLRKEYDCHVMLPDTSGSPERVLTVMGEAEGCVGVLREVLRSLPDNDGKVGEKETQVLIPQPFMGTIIGTGGSKINDLRGRVRATVKIFSEPMPGSNERSIQVIGSAEQISECARSFLDDISKKDCREPIYLYEPGAVEFDAPPPFYNDYSRGRGGGHRGNRGFRGRGSGFTPRGRGGPPPRFTPPHGGPRQPTGVTPPPARPPQFNSTPAPLPPAAPSIPPQAVAPPNSVGYNPAPVGYATSTNNTYLPQVANQPPPQQPKYPAPAPLVPSQSYPPPTQPMPAPTGPPPPQQSSQQVTIPFEYSDAILGPNGSRLASIKGQSSCEITLNPPSLGSNERIITIVGTAQGIQVAQQLMQNSVRQYHPNV